MNEPNKTADQVMPPPGPTTAWWNVRPALRVFLVIEALAIGALFKMDAVSAAVVRAWVRPLAITVEQVQGVLTMQTVITVLAIVSVIAVAIEAARKGRISPRRSEGGQMKVASA